MFSSVSISYTREGKCNKEEGPRRCSERVTVVLRKTFYSAPRRGIIREFAGTITVPRGNRLCFLSASEYNRTQQTHGRTTRHTLPKQNIDFRRVTPRENVLFNTVSDTTAYAYGLSFSAQKFG
jgi:hypothetical protein